MTGGAARSRLADGRWRFRHGPIDCIVLAEGEPGAVANCVDRAWQRFRGVLDELVAELPLLRADLSVPAAAWVAPRGAIARRMVGACRPHASQGRFMTAMAAVAGSVAEELVACFDDPRIARAAVDNGGDIALRLRPGERFEVGVVADLGAAPALAARIAVAAGSAVRGIATSGWPGRSFSFGIADAVTVLARTASAADAAATVIGNAVDVAAPGIVRVAADTLRDDSDLGSRLVTAAVPRLASHHVEAALAAGAARAEAEIAAGRIVAALLCLQGRTRACGDLPLAALGGRGHRNPELVEC